jgi:hypothetical protein
MAQVILGVFIGLGLASLLQVKASMAYWTGLRTWLRRWHSKLSGLSTQARLILAANTANAKQEILPSARMAQEPAVEEPPAAKLRTHESAFLPIADNASHPREFYDDPDFKAAVSILSDPAVPLRTVTQYAFGANWGLSCAAFAALAQRADREGAKDEAFAAFERFVPWVMI